MQRSRRLPPRHKPVSHTRLLASVLLGMAGLSGCLSTTAPSSAGASASEAQQAQEQLSAAQRKISSPLLQAIRQRLEAGGAALENGVQIDGEGRTVVDITANVDDELLARLETLGAEIMDAFPQFRSVRARVQLDRIEAIAEDRDVLFIQPRQDATTNLPPTSP